MVGDLVERVIEVEQLLARRPEYYRDFRHFTRDDVRIVCGFFTAEWSANPVYSQFSKWESLRANPKGLRKPAEAQAKFIRSLNSIKDVLYDSETTYDALQKLGVDLALVRYFGSWFNMLVGAVALRGKLLEQVVAASKQISGETYQNPERLVRERENRDEIYRRIFPEQEQFVALDELFLQVNKGFHEEMSAMLLRSYNSNTSEASKRKIAKRRRKIAPSAVVIEYFDAQKAYEARRANQIYGRRIIAPLKPESS